MSGVHDNSIQSDTANRPVTPEEEYKESQRAGLWQEFQEKYDLYGGAGPVWDFDYGDLVVRKSSPIFEVDNYGQLQEVGRTSPGVSFRKTNSRARIEAQRRQARARGLPGRFYMNSNSRMAFVENADDLPAAAPVENSTSDSQDSSARPSTSSSWTGVAASLDWSGKGINWADEDDDDDMLVYGDSSRIAEVLAAATLPELPQRESSAETEADVEDTMVEEQQPQVQDTPNSKLSTEPESATGGLPGVTIESAGEAQNQTPNLTLDVEDLKFMLLLLEKSPGTLPDYVAELNKSIEATIYNAKIDLHADNERLRQELETQTALFRAHQLSAMGLEDELQSENEDLQERVSRRDHTIERLTAEKDKAIRSRDSYKQEWLKVGSENARLVVEAKKRATVVLDLEHAVKEKDKQKEKAAMYREERNMLYAQVKSLKSELARAHGEHLEVKKEKEEILRQALSDRDAGRDTRVASVPGEVEKVDGAPLEPQKVLITIDDIRRKVEDLEAQLRATKAAEAEEVIRTEHAVEEIRKLKVRRRQHSEQLIHATDLVERLRAKLTARQKARKGGGR